MTTETVETAVATTETEAGTAVGTAVETATETGVTDLEVTGIAGTATATIVEMTARMGPPMMLYSRCSQTRVEAQSETTEIDEIATTTAMMTGEGTEPAAETDNPSGRSRL